MKSFSGFHAPGHFAAILKNHLNGEWDNQRTSINILLQFVRQLGITKFQYLFLNETFRDREAYVWGAVYTNPTES
jgi:hypothetical protein